MKKHLQQSIARLGFGPLGEPFVKGRSSCSRWGASLAPRAGGLPYDESVLSLRRSKRVRSFTPYEISVGRQTAEDWLRSDLDRQTFFMLACHSKLPARQRYPLPPSLITALSVTLRWREVPQFRILRRLLSRISLSEPPPASFTQQRRRHCGDIAPLSPASVMGSLFGVRAIWDGCRR